MCRKVDKNNEGYGYGKWEERIRTLPRVFLMKEDKISKGGGEVKMCPLAHESNPTKVFKLYLAYVIRNEYCTCSVW